MQNGLENFEDVRKLMEYAFNDCNNYSPYSSIDYLTTVEFNKLWNNE